MVILITSWMTERHFLAVMSSVSSSSSSWQGTGLPYRTGRPCQLGLENNPGLPWSVQLRCSWLEGNSSSLHQPPFITRRLSCLRTRSLVSLRESASENCTRKSLWSSHLVKLPGVSVMWKSVAVLNLVEHASKLNVSPASSKVNHPA